MNRQLFEYHPMVGYKFIPGLKARIPHEAGGYLLRTNESGFRSEIEFVKERIPGKKRILFFGDSFTAGDGVSNKFRFTDLIQEIIPGVESYNFGLPGSGTDQQYLMFREFGAGIQADLLVIMVLVENIRRVNSHYRYYYDERGNRVVYQKPYFEFKNGVFSLCNVPVLQHPLKFEDLSNAQQGKVDVGGRFEAARSLVGALGFRELAQRIIRYQPVPEYNQAGSPGWKPRGPPRLSAR